MKAAFKFLMHKNGISAFAAISVDAIPSSQFSVTWSNDLTQHERGYGTVVREGIADAMRWHCETVGSPAAFTVTEFTELVVDTKPDAVRCASSAAAWKALGHSETEMNFSFRR